MEGALIGVDKAGALIAWLQEEEDASGRGRRKRRFSVRDPNHPKISFYGQEPEVADEFLVYIMEGRPDASNIESFSVRYVGYQMGMRFETFVGLKNWVANCILLGQHG